MKERIADSEIRLIPYYRNDAVSLPWYQDPDICRQVDNRDEPYDLALLHRMYDYLCANGDCFYIEFKGELVGDVSLRNNSEIAIVISKAFQNQHIGRRCVMEMLKLAEEKGMDSVKANVYSFNHQSQHMFESAGFYKTAEEWYRYDIRPARRESLRIGLVSYRCENRNIPFNLRQIERAMQRCEGKADLVCFGEAFLQGFDALCWDYAVDQSVAVGLASETIAQLRSWTLQYGVSLLTGYIEKDREKLYSSCVVISEGEIVHNYRRISKGWKEFTKTDAHYGEGEAAETFRLHGKDMMLALCGDLWDFPERFRTEHLLIWPVYVNYTPEEWDSGALEEYAAQAAQAADDTLMINPLDRDPANHGGSFHFHKGQIMAKLPFDREEILIVEI